MKKIVLIVLDGLGDKAIPELDNMTPLEAAKTSNLDTLVKGGKCGLMKPVHHTALPSSEEGHMALFGYSIEDYPVKRGLFTTTGAGIKLQKGDVAMRANFATVDVRMNVVDRRAGRIDNTDDLIKAVNGLIIDGIKFIVKYAGGHRVGIVMRGPGLSANISEGDPHYGKLQKGLREIESLDKTPEAKFTAEVLNKFLKKTHLLLKDHPLNKRREQEKLLPGNYFLTRGICSYIIVPTLKQRYRLNACCVAGKILYKQIGKVLGMDLIEVKGADGSVKTNLKGKIEAVVKGLRKYDFVFLHIKATDSLGEDGDYQAKKEFIEKVDRHLKPLLGLKNVLIVVTADHSTCCSLKRHCTEPIPIVIYGAEKDDVSQFSEKECRKGKLGRFNQLELMPKLLELYKEK
jgi:2,3-bisphosphoglycerate-independent phosphoglycerate mutase